MQDIPAAEARYTALYGAETAQRVIQACLYGQLVHEGTQRENARALRLRPPFLTRLSMRFGADPNSTLQTASIMIRGRRAHRPEPTCKLTLCTL